MPDIDFNILMILGLSLFAATGAGRILSRFRVPGVIVCIATGMLLGRAGAGLLDEDALQALTPLNYFALGLIGFVVGGELRKDVLRKYGRALMRILLLGVGGSFVFVFLCTFAASYFFTGNLGASAAVSLLLGAVASASDPATQTEIVMETRSKGPLTSNIMGVTALSDAAAIGLFALASAAAARIIGLSHGIGAVWAAGYEVLGAAGLGWAAGWGFARILDTNPGKEIIAGVSFGFILFLVGKSVSFHLDMILCLMTFGFVLVNMRPERSRQVFRVAGQAVQPVFVLFFVILGASLETVYFSAFPAFMVLFYLTGIAAGRIAGIRLGARISRSPGVVCRYLPYSLFSQAGIAVGLTVLAVQTFPDEIGSMLVGIVTPAVLILQVLGPALTRNALQKAGETGLNVTEQDILESVKVSEVLPPETSSVYEDTTIAEVLKLFSSGDELYYPVVSADKRLLGVVSVEGIRYTLMEQELGDFLLVFDIMEPVPVTVGEDAFLSYAVEIMDSYQVDFLPVVDGGNYLKGFIEKRMIRKFVSSKLIMLGKRMSHIDSRG